MVFRAPMSRDESRVLEAVVAAVGTGTLTEFREELQGRPKGTWLAPPLLTAAAGLIEVIVEARGGEEPWAQEETVWDEHLPDRKPVGRSEWRNANYALHAAGCLAAGVWLDVGRQESFWNFPLWPFALDLVELLTAIAQAAPTALNPGQIHTSLVSKINATPST